MECPGRSCEPRRTTQGTDRLGHSGSSASVDPPLHCRDPAAPGGASGLPDRLTFYGFPHLGYYLPQTEPSYQEK